MEKYGKIMKKSWKNDGILRKNHRKSWKNNGKIIEKSWEILEK